MLLNQLQVAYKAIWKCYNNINILPNTFIVLFWRNYNFFYQVPYKHLQIASSFCILYIEKLAKH